MTKVIPYTSGMSNGYFVIGFGGAIAVDTGSVEGETTVLELCEAAGLRPEELRLLIITHGHVDHFYNLPAMKRVTGAPVLCHTAAGRYLREGLLPDVTGRTDRGRAILAVQDKEGPPLDHAPQIEPDILINDVYDLDPWGVAGKLIPTPGHSDGCISVVLDNGAAIVGDLYAAPAGTNDGGMAFFTYPGGRFEEAQESLQRLLDMGVQIFYSGHGGPYSRKEVERALAEEREGAMPNKA